MFELKAFKGKQMKMKREVFQDEVGTPVGQVRYDSLSITSAEVCHIVAYYRSQSDGMLKIFTSRYPDRTASNWRDRVPIDGRGRSDTRQGAH